MKVLVFAQDVEQFDDIRSIVADRAPFLDQPWIPPNKLPIGSLGKMEALMRGTVDPQSFLDLIIIDRKGFPQNVSPQEGFESLQLALPDLKKKPPAVIYLQQPPASMTPTVMLSQRVRYLPWRHDVPFEKNARELRNVIEELFPRQSLQQSVVREKVKEKESIYF
jgi:hypothetical protein